MKAELEEEEPHPGLMLEIRLLLAVDTLALGETAEENEAGGIPEEAGEMTRTEEEEEEEIIQEEEAAATGGKEGEVATPIGRIVDEEEENPGKDI